MDLKKLREEAVKLAPNDPPECGWSRWLDARLASEREPPITPWWRGTLEDFWRSGCPFFASTKGQRSTASTTITRTLVMETLLRPREVVLGQLAVCVIMSAGTAEANQRCDPLEAVLVKGPGLVRVDKVDKVEAGTFFASLSPQTGRSFFQAVDADGHQVRWSVSPATREAASGSTGAGALVDELDLWQAADGGKNPAPDVLTLLHGRIHGQHGAHVYHVSTPARAHAPLSLLINESAGGGADGLYVARLGELGARRDGEAREAFREYLRERARTAPDRLGREAAARWEADPRLARDPDPRSTSIPTWAARAELPIDALLECWKLAGVRLKKGEEGGDPLDVLFARYGAQPGGDDGRRIFGPALIAAARERVPSW